MPRSIARKTARPAPRRPTLITLALEWFLNPDHLPLVAAKEAGYFRDEGLELSIVVPTVPEESLDLVARGKTDFGIGEQTNLIKARSAGDPLVSLGPLLTHTVVCLMFLKDGPITRLEDLRGRRVGWPGLEIDLPILGTMLGSAGLTHADIQPVDVGFALTDALLAGRADAVFGAFINYEQVEAEQKGAAVRFVSPTDAGVPDLYQLVVFTSDRMVTRQSAIVRGFTRAYQRGLRLTADQPGKALLLYQKAHSMADPDLSRMTFEATRPYFPTTIRQDPARWKAVHDWLLQRGILKRKLPVSFFFTNVFVPRFTPV
ncbi:MAG: ABC transporter substrate-binding protein [Nitrospirales bacterium]